jgi:AbrB family looped-hinge helix DNA binding protein
MRTKRTATLSSKYQISIPKRVREAHGWKPGQEFAFIPRGKHVVLVPVPELEDLMGIARGANTDDYRDRNDRY